MEQPSKRVSVKVVERASELVALVSDLQIRKLFAGYTQSCYGRLSINPVLPLGVEDKRRALRLYMIRCLEGTDTERRAFVQGRLDDGRVDELLWIIHNDQYYREPLYHVANTLDSHSEL